MYINIIDVIARSELKLNAMKSRLMIITDRKIIN